MAKKKTKIDRVSMSRRAGYRQNMSGNGVKKVTGKGRVNLGHQSCGGHMKAPKKMGL